MAHKAAIPLAHRPPLAPYSPADRHRPASCSVAGQVGLDPANGAAGRRRRRGAGGAALRNLTPVLEAAGLTMADVVKTTCFLTDMDDFEAFNGVYAQARRRSQARAIHVRCSRRCRAARRVEIEAIAVRG